jgi:hypothetical protein
MRSASSPPVDRRRFLLELWLEPRAVTTRDRRLRGRIKELRDDDTGRGVASLQDIDEYIHSVFASAFEAAGADVRWEIEP